MKNRFCFLFRIFSGLLLLVCSYGCSLPLGRKASATGNRAFISYSTPAQVGSGTLRLAVKDLIDMAGHGDNRGVAVSGQNICSRGKRRDMPECSPAIQRADRWQNESHRVRAGYLRAWTRFTEHRLIHWIATVSPVARPAARLSRWRAVKRMWLSVPTAPVPSAFRQPVAASWG